MSSFFYCAAGATDCLVSTVNIGILFSSHVVLVLLLLITKQIQCIMYNKGLGNISDMRNYPHKYSGKSCVTKQLWEGKKWLIH